MSFFYTIYTFLFGYNTVGKTGAKNQKKKYSKIPILRPPLGLSKSGLKDHFWTVAKVVYNRKYTGCRK